MYDAKNYKLCFVDNLYAYFTTGEPLKMWGFGWEVRDNKDVCSPPKSWNEESELEPYNIYKVHFGPGLTRFNEDKAINYINEKKLAFLKRYFSEDYIHSGCTLNDFLDFCSKHRIEVFFQYSQILDIK